MGLPRFSLWGAVGIIVILVAVPFLLCIALTG